MEKVDCDHRWASLSNKHLQEEGKEITTLDPALEGEWDDSYIFRYSQDGHSRNGRPLITYRS